MSHPTKHEDGLEQLQRLWGQRIAEGSQQIARMPINEQPRAKLIARGPIALSNLELMAVLLGAGTRFCDVLCLAARILKVLDQSELQPDVEELLKIAGVGPAKAAIVVAAFEFSRRRIHPRGFSISWSTDVLPFIRHVCAFKKEHLVCISLNRINEVLAIRTVAVGLVDQAHIHPRDVFADPITDRASAIIIAHNHSSGDVNPSRDDKLVTQELKSAGKLLGVQLLDHLIFNDRDYYSFLEKGDL